MLNFRLSENCHLLKQYSTYFCSMITRILPALVLFIAIISCNNQDGTKKNGEPASLSAAEYEKILKDSVARFPDSLLLRENLVQFYRDNADYDKALATVDQAIQKDSINARLWDIRGTLHFENEDTVQAIRSFEKALRLNPMPRYLILLGSLYAQTKNTRALAVADALLQSKLPETEKEAYFIKGMYFTYTGDKSQAIAFFDKCLNLDNRHMFAYREKGIALYDMGKYQEATAVLNKAVTLQNNFDEGYYWLGRCYEKLDKPNDAIDAYKTALLYSPDYVEAKDALTRLSGK